VSRIATFVQKINVKVSRILHSGKARAKQTAQMLADNLKPEKGISETESLAPMDDPDIWIKRINGMNEDIMFVVHLPYMAKLTGVLLCGDKIKRRHVSIKRWGELSVANALTIGDGPLSG
jgi:phosphohistidine phosphatase